MFRPLTRSHRRPPRRGTAILITCFFLLTVMMVLGLALIMYAAREKAAAQAFQDAASTPSKLAPPPENTVNQFFGAFLFDTDNDGVALQNSLRGHSIARSMYGSRSDYSAPANVWGGSTVPWAGVGTFREDASLYPTGVPSPATFPSLAGINRAQIVNHTGLRVDGQFLTVDPEWTGNRPVSGGALPAFANSRTGNYVGKHAGYTYPDLKNYFLGARDPATGEVLVQSFHRDWLFRHASQPAGESALHPNNPNWNNDAGAVLTLRPRPKDHPNFPRVGPDADGVYRGDVQNSPGSYRYDPNLKQFIAQNDSLWMHIGLPPITLEGGRIVQPMVAPLILPLDGNFDMSMHGNQLAGTAPGLPTTSPSHRSYGGYGSWEVNSGYGMTNPWDAAPAPAPLTLSAALENERRLLIQNRGISANGQPARTAFNSYAINGLLPTYSSVAWSGQQVNFTLPSGGSLLGVPSSGDPTAPAYGNFQNDGGVVSPHPAGHNPNEFADRSDNNPNSPAFPYSDLKRLSLRYAFTPDWYSQAFATRTAGATFSGDATNFPFVSAPGQNTLPAAGKFSYRLDTAHTRRLLFSPRTTGLDRPAVAPNFVSRDQITALTQVPSAIAGLSAKPGPLFVNPTAYPTPTGAPLGAITDFAAGNQWLNVQAALGSVNLNRPLADYRTDTTLPLSTANVTPASVAQAEADRQQLAKDIFARLIVALGAAGQVSFDTNSGVVINLPQPTGPNAYTLTIPGTPPTTIVYNQQQYDALRYLAQVAVNLVDYIDNDDVSTTFVWNPSNVANPAASLVADLGAREIGNRAVFGVEKPRLVINEVYGEITNAPEDPPEDAPDPAPLPPLPKALPAGALAHVKFWAELVNPTTTPHNPPAVPPPAVPAQGIFGTGAVNLSAYQIQISRANRNNVLPANQAGDLATYLSDPANTTGRLGDPTAAIPLVPDATFTFPQTPIAGQPGSVAPNNGAYRPNPATLPAEGVVLVGPQLPVKTIVTVPSAEFNPPAAGVWAAGNKVESAPLTTAPPGTAMGYTFTMPAAGALVAPEFKRHVVLLRRLVNPYLAANDPTSGTFNAALAVNPYVTVDVMDYVPALDAVHRAAGGRNDRGPYDATNKPTGYDPVPNRFSVGKVQPLAGRSVATVRNGHGPANNNLYTFNSANQALSSMVLAQKAAPTLPAAANEPRNTFGRHNGIHAGTGADPAPIATTVAAGTPATLLPAGNADTIMLPFDWLPHLDRPLESLGDVFTVRDTKPHLLTSEFVVNTNAAPGLVYDGSYAKWRNHGDGIERALAYLTVKSPDYRVAHGGRVGGLVNVNAMQDRRVARGVWDPQANNRFDVPFVDTTIWGQWMNSRTVLQNRTGPDGAQTFTVPVPNQRFNTTTSLFEPAPSITEDPTGSDRPFQPFGAPAVTPPVLPATTNGTFAYTAPTLTGDGDTILRRQNAAGTLPYLYQPTETHAYTQTEPVRKVLNNVTTVSHTFVVYLTIGYFDVKTVARPANWPSNVPDPVEFGAEVYDQIPGDMRQKYVAVIDMSNMALRAQFAPQFAPTPTAADPEPNNPQAVVRPFFTALDQTARPGARATPLSIAYTSYDNTNAANPVLYVAADGVQQPITAGTQLVLGYGADTQVVNVQAVDPVVAGRLTVSGLTRTAWAGTCVSNVRPGYAGPQPGFRVDDFRYKPVLPYIERVR